MLIRLGCVVLFVYLCYFLPVFDLICWVYYLDLRVLIWLFCVGLVSLVILVLALCVCFVVFMAYLLRNLYVCGFCVVLGLLGYLVVYLVYFRLLLVCAL